MIVNRTNASTHRTIPKGLYQPACPSAMRLLEHNDTLFCIHQQCNTSHLIPAPKARCPDLNQACRVRANKGDLICVSRPWGKSQWNMFISTVDCKMKRFWCEFWPKAGKGRFTDLTLYLSMIKDRNSVYQASRQLSEFLYLGSYDINRM